MVAVGKVFATTIGPGALTGGAVDPVVIRSPPSETDELRITSGVLHLCRYSRLHASYPVEMLIRRIRPSLPLEQFLYCTDPLGVPIAFCNWAWLNVSVLDDVLATGRDLRAHEFQCGDQPFFYELLAPFGHCRALVRNLRSMSQFKGRRIPAIRGEVCDGTQRVPRVKYFQF
ncbi:cytolysin-activating lysine-acyltransferase [Rhizobiales bacterium GAS191]|nr:cytolysin-activating lysine-acyltransferase [Rhizobiales bacterium GAS191]